MTETFIYIVESLPGLKLMLDKAPPRDGDPAFALLFCADEGVDALLKKIGMVGRQASAMLTPELCWRACRDAAEATRQATELLVSRPFVREGFSLSALYEPRLYRSIHQELIRLRLFGETARRHPKSQWIFVNDGGKLAVSVDIAAETHEIPALSVAGTAVRPAGAGKMAGGELFHTVRRRARLLLSAGRPSPPGLSFAPESALIAVDDPGEDFETLLALEERIKRETGRSGVFVARRPPIVQRLRAASRRAALFDQLPSLRETFDGHFWRVRIEKSLDRKETGAKKLAEAMDAVEPGLSEAFLAQSPYFSERLADLHRDLRTAVRVMGAARPALAAAVEHDSRFCRMIMAAAQAMNVPTLMAQGRNFGARPLDAFFPGVVKAVWGPVQFGKTSNEEAEGTIQTSGGLCFGDWPARREAFRARREDFRRTVCLSCKLNPGRRLVVVVLGRFFSPKAAAAANLAFGWAKKNPDCNMIALRSAEANAAEVLALARAAGVVDPIVRGDLNPEEAMCGADAAIALPGAAAVQAMLAGCPVALAGDPFGATDYQGLVRAGAVWPTFDGKSLDAALEAIFSGSEKAASIRKKAEKWLADCFDRESPGNDFSALKAGAIAARARKNISV